MSLLKTGTLLLTCSLALMGLNSCGKIESTQPWNNPLPPEAKGLSTVNVKKANLIADISNPYKLGEAEGLFLFKHRILVEGEGSKDNEGSLVFKLFEYVKDREFKREFIVTKNSLGNFRIEDLQEDSAVARGIWGPKGKGIELITYDSREKWELVPVTGNNLALNYRYYLEESRTPTEEGVLNKKSEMVPALDGTLARSCLNYVNKLGLKLFAEKTLVDTGGGMGLMRISDSKYSMLLESLLEQRKDLPKNKPNKPSPYGDLANLMKDFVKTKMGQMSVSHSSGMFEGGVLLEKVCKPSDNPKKDACKSYLSERGVDTTDSLRVLRASLYNETGTFTNEADVIAHIERLNEMSDEDKTAMVEEVFQGLFDDHNRMVDSTCAYRVYRDTLSRFVKLDSDGEVSYDSQGRMNLADDVENSCADKSKIAGRTAMRKKIIQAECVTKL